MTKRLAAIILAFVFLFGVSTGVIKSVTYAKTQHDRIIATKNELTRVEGLSDEAQVTIMVELEDEPAMKAQGYNVKGTEDYSNRLLKDQAKAKKNVESVLGMGIEVDNSYTLLFNGFSFKGSAGMIKEINRIDGLTAFAAPTFSLPKTVASTEIINATEMWALGYTGKGTVIAVLDTGILAEHEAFSVAPPDAKITEESLKAIMDEYGAYMHAGSNTRKLYESDKIPFAYDYQAGKYGAEHTSSSDHGTHVAGIAAGNNGTDFRGVAYDAQILAMQVFYPTGGAGWDAILAALEDCAYLGVDAANMSLGSAAGYSAYYEDSYEEVFDLLEESGVAIAAAAGNENSTADGNAWGGYSLTANPDSGLVDSPSTWATCFSVASSNNATVCSGSVKVGEHEFGYADPFAGTELSFDTIAGTYKYVLCGLGTQEEVAGLDLTGKIAVISRGNITFTEKANNAAARGAKGVIIYNNQDGVINMSIESPIPAVSVLQVYGQYLIENANNNEGKLKISSGLFIDYSSAKGVSDFSSAGTTSDLKIKPEITAPGGNITSAVGFSGPEAYETWSGTSMATPHVAGGVAIVQEYIEKRFPNLTARERLNMVYAILMSTAAPLDGELVRKQGAGLMNMKGALTTNAYLTAKDGGRPKIELDEIENGKFTLEFKVVNVGDKAITYDVATQVLVDTPYTAGTYGEYTVYVTDFDALDITEDCDVKSQSSVTVNAGKTVTVKVEVTMHEDLLADIAELFPSGTYAEGYVTLTPRTTSEGVQDATLSIPFLGFAGDWDYAAIIDYAYYWQDATGDYNWYSNPELPYNYIGYSDDVDLMYGAGINPYGDGSMPEGSFSYDRIAVSPGKSDIDYIAFSLLRNAKSLQLNVRDEMGKVIETINDYGDYAWRKEYMTDSGYTYSDLGIDLDYSRFEENTLIYISLDTVLDHEGYSMEKNQNGTWRVPVIIDGTAPYITDIKLSSDMLTVKALDTNYIAKIGVYKDAAMTEALTEKLFYADIKGTEEAVSVELDKTELVYIVVADYAQNERVYLYNTTDGSLTEQYALDEYAQHVTVWADSFEDSSTYGSWDTLDADGNGSAWGIYDDDGLASDGKYFLASVADAEVYQENYIISDRFDIPEDGLTYKLAFDVATLGSDERYAVYALDIEDDGSYSIAAQMLYSVASGEEYKTVTVDLTKFAGQSFYIGWCHMGIEGTALLLDNLKIYYLDAFASLDASYTESFEGTDTAWKSIDNDGDGFKFDVIDNEGMASDGTHAMYSKSMNTNTWTSLTSDNWLISGSITIAKSPELTYFTFDSISVMDMHDTYEVYIGTNATVSAMKTLIYRANAEGEWRNTSLNLTYYAGKTIYIGIRHICSDGFMLGIDNVKIYTVEHPKEYMVKFINSLTGEVIGMKRYESGSVIYGMPFGPSFDNNMFAGWDYDGKPVTKDMEIKSVYVLRGDLTRDGKVNTGDAAEALRWSASEKELTRIELGIADYNQDGRFNTGDAVAILRYSAGLNP